MRFKYIFISLLLCFITCKSKLDDELIGYDISSCEMANQLKTKIDSSEFISLFGNYYSEELGLNISHIDINRYTIDCCLPITYSKEDYFKNYEGLKAIDDLDGDSIIDSVFVLKPLSYCDLGESYYFTNERVPRIETDSYCCHVDNIFSLGDIDGDGSLEIGQYYSSCASRFKSIFIWTLKGEKWIKVKRFTFTLNKVYKMPDDYKKLFRSTDNGIIEYLEISDVLFNGEIVSQWKLIDMNVCEVKDTTNQSSIFID